MPTNPSDVQPLGGDPLGAPDFPDGTQPTTVSLAGTSTSQAFSRSAAMAQAAALAARSAAITAGKAAGAFARPLHGTATAISQARGALAGGGTAALQALAAAMAHGRAQTSAAALLIARSTGAGTARAKGTFAMPLQARAVAMAAGRAGMTIGVALKARGQATARGAGIIIGTAALAARSVAQSAGQLLNTTGLALISARAAGMARGAASLSRAAALKARAAAAATGRAAPNALLSLAGKSGAAAAGRAVAGTFLVITARAGAVSKGAAQAALGLALVARGQAASAGRGFTGGMTMLAARSTAMARGGAQVMQALVARSTALSAGSVAGFQVITQLFATGAAASKALAVLFAPKPIIPVGLPTPPSPRRANVPFLPPITPNVLPEAPFDSLIEQYGVSLLWLQSHQCPCVNSGEIIGTADPSCGTCKGLGVYWDNPVGPWMGLITFMHMSPTPDEPGIMTNDSFGLVQHGEPTLTIPYGAVNGQVWESATLYDAFVEQNALARLSAQLVVGGVETVPYQQGLVIDPQGAVTVWDPVAKVVTPVVGYTVNGGAVTLPPSYPVGTAYNVEFQANPVYIAYRKAGGMPHIRPFGAGAVNLPRRFRIQPLDIWTRARQGGSSPQISR